MDRPKILVTHRLFEEPRAKLAEHFEVEFWSDSDRPPRAEVLRRVADKDGLICLLTEKIDDELLAAAPRLRMVANIAVGFDNIDLDACTRRNVAVSNKLGVLDVTNTDFACGRGTVAHRGRRARAFRRVEGLEPRPALRRGYLGQDARHPGLRPDW